MASIGSSTVGYIAVREPEHGVKRKPKGAGFDVEDAFLTLLERELEDVACAHAEELAAVVPTLSAALAWPGQA